jgi:hypothetical protein
MAQVSEGDRTVDHFVDRPQARNLHRIIASARCAMPAWLEVLLNVIGYAASSPSRCIIAPPAKNERDPLGLQSVQRSKVARLTRECGFRAKQRSGARNPRACGS